MFFSVQGWVQFIATLHYYVKHIIGPIIASLLPTLLLFSVLDLEEDIAGQGCLKDPLLLFGHDI